MQTFGYRRDDADADEPELIELREVSLPLTRGQIDDLIAFLQNARMKFGSGAPISGQAHEHYSFWSRNWKEGDADLVIVFMADTPAR